jgi:hypothetical protein
MQKATLVAITTGCVGALIFMRTIMLMVLTAVCLQFFDTSQAAAANG